MSNGESASKGSTNDEHPEKCSEVDDSPRCSCGHDRHHHLVSQERSYTSWGGFWVMVMGVSASPIRIDFRCRRCKEKFDFITNPKELKRYL